MNSNKATNLVWIDLEMTGLEFDKDRIIQIAVLITNQNLEVIAEGPEIIIRQPRELFDSNNPFIKEQFIDSGFINDVENSTYSEESAEKEVLNFIMKYVDEGVSPLCGNSVYMDRMFIRTYMRKLDDYLHYRLVDVSTIKNLYQRWYSQMPEYQKSDTHRAMDDIKESIEELKHYRNTIFK